MAGSRGLARTPPRLNGAGGPPSALSSLFPKLSASLEQGRPQPLRVDSLLRLAIARTRPRSLIHQDPNDTP
ncbi:hypothetical protein Scani_77540 [Streptomyces caniferus]|uniref:Uncharacterized protein n=1 Tax=Streptomyces caniferus TaxID=285557 RepID=A0A640SMX8_9ACTN|nr:hypothetical protein Scani_77540 [Streptomyces caniferus]